MATPSSTCAEDDAAAPPSLRGDVRLAHDAAPLLGLGREVLRRAAAACRRACVAPISARRFFTAGSASTSLATRSCARRPRRGVPLGASSANQVDEQQLRLAELGGRRHVGQRRRALRRHHRDRAHLAALHLPGDAGDELEHQLDLAGDQVGGRGARRVVRHVDHLRAGLAHEELAGEVHRAADAGRAEVELAGVGLGVALELGEVLRRDVVVDDEDVGHVGDEHDRHEVLLRVEGQVLVERLVDRQRAGPAEQEVVAVARRRRPPRWRRCCRWRRPCCR